MESVGERSFDERIMVEVAESGASDVVIALNNHCPSSITDVSWETGLKTKLGR